MQEDFSGLNAATDRVVDLINETIAILENPVSDNNNQDVIDAIKTRLTAAADALSAAETPAPAPVEAPTETPVDPEAPAA